MVAKVGREGGEGLVWVCGVVLGWCAFMMRLARARAKGWRWGYRIASGKQFRLD